jgi:HPt (histidine-containing phosphotransfer) domain-containing protein
MTSRPNPPLPVDPAAAAASAPVAGLDADALEKLRSLDPHGHAGIVPRVLRTFDGSLAKLMRQFEKAREPQDLEVLRYVAHTLRSSSASVGALALSRCCGVVESRVQNGHTADMGPALDEMAAESARASAAVRAMLAVEGTAA